MVEDEPEPKPKAVPLDWDNLPDQFTVEMLRRLPVRDLIELERVLAGESTRHTFTELQRTSFERAREGLPLRHAMKHLAESQGRVNQLSSQVLKALASQTSVAKASAAAAAAAKAGPKVDFRFPDYPSLSRSLALQTAALARLDSLRDVEVPSPVEEAVEERTADELAAAYRRAADNIDARVGELVNLAHLQVQSGQAVAEVLTSDRKERDRLKFVAWLLTIVVLFQAALDSFNSEHSLNVGRALFAALGVWILAKAISYLAHRQAQRRELKVRGRDDEGTAA